MKFLPPQSRALIMTSPLCSRYGLNPLCTLNLFWPTGELNRQSEMILKCYTTEPQYQNRKLKSLANLNTSKFPLVLTYIRINLDNSKHC